MPKISGLEVFKVDIPFRAAFKHSLKSRQNSESIFVKASLDSGVTGFGESLPRSYVTGNTQDAVYAQLKEFLPKLLGAELNGLNEGALFIRSLDGIEAEARCALEIALLDCLGKVSNVPVHDILGETLNQSFASSAVISEGSVLKTAVAAIYFKSKGYRFFKVKVGSYNDPGRIRLVRRLVGDADIRIDANGAWDVMRALEMVEKIRRFDISCVEQPTPKDDFDAMQEMADFCTEPVMADESLCTVNDALKLAQIRGCDMFNVRLSKCGGINKCMEIIKIALDHEMGYQIGCHVGESGVLTAAAMHLAAVSKRMAYFEGGYSRLLLKEDIIEEDLTPRRGIGYTLNKPGLGVTVNEDILRKYVVE
ncbi:MAG: enolase C-terminal domain-like protein [Candidatus Omnitrophota bacterium]|nr:enolase C-terminal domain-like protein [Candidatus Omnitrophota bacterium]